MSAKKILDEEETKTDGTLTRPNRTAALAAIRRAHELDSSFWVIEAMWQPPHYIKAHGIGSCWDFAWT